MNENIPNNYLNEIMNNTNEEEKEDTKFECNICFGSIKFPTTTKCGHLFWYIIFLFATIFSWECIYKWLN